MSMHHLMYPETQSTIPSMSSIFGSQSAFQSMVYSASHIASMASGPLPHCSHCNLLLLNNMLVWWREQDKVVIWTATSGQGSEAEWLLNIGIQLVQILIFSGGAWNKLIKGGEGGGQAWLKFPVFMIKVPECLVWSPAIKVWMTSHDFTFCGPGCRNVNSNCEDVDEIPLQIIQMKTNGKKLDLRTTEMLFRWCVQDDITCCSQKRVILSFLLTVWCARLAWKLEDTRMSPISDLVATSS